MPITPFTRLAHAAVAIALFWGAMDAFGPGTPLFWIGLVIPDVALIGLGGAAPGQLHPRWVPLYNGLHTWWTPLAIGAACLLVPSLAPLALGWAAHVAWDRTWGYGLRTPEGFQRHEPAPAAG